MADAYLTISWIARNQAMRDRMTACVTQQIHLGSFPAVIDETGAAQWVDANAFVWASSPTWAEKWDYALQTHPPVPAPPPSPVPYPPQIYDPGLDDTVITDADILATVQALGTE